MEKFGIIYKITNLVNDKVYVGQTSHSLDKRWSEHLRDIKRESSESRTLCRAIRKYGPESFKKEIIETTELTNLNERERFWIKKLNSLSFNSGFGYNMTIGGEGIRGRVQSQEEKAKRAKSMTGLKRNQEFKDGMSLKMMNRDITWAPKISEGMKKRLADNPEHMAAVVKQAKDAAIQNKRPVEALIDNVWVEFASRKELASTIKVSASNISMALSDAKHGKVTLVKGLQIRSASPKNDLKETVKEN